jgi:hypothetical protein
MADGNRCDGWPSVARDSVAKVTTAKLWNRNLKRSNRAAWIFESHCALAPDLESILRAQRRKIVLQHNLPEAVIDQHDADRATLSPKRDEC